MNFSDPAFIFIYLPIATILFCMVCKYLPDYRLLSIATASSVFYMIWSAEQFIAILVPSILINYFYYRRITASGSSRTRVLLFYLALATNIVILCYFKYWADISFILKNTVALEILIPLGISFWTFQQIAFLVNAMKYSRSCPVSVLEYFAIITFFPHMIAGPIVRVEEIVTQIRGSSWRVTGIFLRYGLLLVTIGLLKKVALADQIAPFVDRIFSLDNSLLESVGPTVLLLSTVSFIVQLYFDFSGYSDMAIGLALMFGIRFPVNFNNPLRSGNMWEFWKRWHMSLTRFFTDILYAPLTLAVNRWLFNSITSRNNRFYSAALAKCVEFGPILFIFVITGIWHGSGAQFVIFGLLNGIAVYVGIYYSRSVAYKKIYGPILIFSNLIVVSIIFVYFRANSLEQANTIVALIFGYKSSWLASSNGFESGLFDYRSVLAVIVGLIVIFFKSTIYDFLPSRVRPLYYRGSGSIRISARIGFPLAIGGGVIVALCLSKLLNGNFVDFIYFKF